MNLKSAMISIDNIKYKSNIGYNEQMVYSNHKSQRFKFRPMDEWGKPEVNISLCIFRLPLSSLQF